MNEETSQFETHLAETLGRLAQAAPPAPDEARVLARLARRRAVRGALAAAAACAILAGAMLAWHLLPAGAGRSSHSLVGPGVASLPPENVPPAAPAAPPRPTGPGFVPALPGVAFSAPAIAMPASAMRMEIPPLSIGPLAGTPAACTIRCILPGISLTMNVHTNPRTTHERTLQ